MSKVHYQGEPSVILRDESHIFLGILPTLLKLSFSKHTK